jgi:hypothetical protein
MGSGDMAYLSQLLPGIEGLGNPDRQPQQQRPMFVVVGAVLYALSHSHRRGLLRFTRQPKPTRVIYLPWRL